VKIAAAVGHRFGGLRPPYATPHNRYRWKGTVGSPSIGTETLFRPSRPPLYAKARPQVGKVFLYLGIQPTHFSYDALNQISRRASARKVVTKFVLAECRA